MRAVIIRKVNMDCPICDKVHEVEERKRKTSITIKGEEVSYEERFYFCENADEEENNSSSLSIPTQFCLSSSAFIS